MGPFRNQDQIAAMLCAWAQWRAGDGVRGQVAQICWTEEAARTREQRAAAFRLPVVPSDAEHTDRALAMLKTIDRKGCDALIAFHLGVQHGRQRGSASIDAIRRAAKLRCNADVEPVLRRSHENFGYCRAQTARAAIENPSTGAALRAVAA